MNRFGLMTGAVALLVLGQPAVYRRLPKSFIQQMNIARTLGEPSGDKIRGYYQDLSDSLGELYEMLPPAENWIPLRRSPAVTRVPDLRRYVFKPNADVVFTAVELKTNRWGMRDHDYDKAPAPGEFRTAILGACNAMGWGVDLDQSLTKQLETLLDRHGSGEPASTHYDVMNFAVGGHFPLAIAQHFEKSDVLSFHPQVVFLYALPDDVELVTEELRRIDQRDLDDPTTPQYVKDAARAFPQGSTRQDERQQWVVAQAALGNSYERIGAACRAAGVLPVWLYVDNPFFISTTTAPYKARMFEDAARAGFVTVDLSHVFDDIKDRRELILNDWEEHLNVKAHTMVANALYHALLANPTIRERLFAAPQ